MVTVPIDKAPRTLVCCVGSGVGARTGTTPKHCAPFTCPPLTCWFFQNILPWSKTAGMIPTPRPGKSWNPWYSVERLCLHLGKLRVNADTGWEWSWVLCLQAEVVGQPGTLTAGKLRSDSCEGLIHPMIVRCDQKPRRMDPGYGF